MQVLVGLGNPGIKYAATRHNFGYKAVERVASAYNIPMTNQKFSAIYGEGKIAGEKVILLKPLTFMNDSGRSVAACLNFFQLPLSNLLVFYDDIDLPVGRIRIRPQGSAGGHNGIKSLIAHLHSEEFSRVRLGVGPQPVGIDSAEHVLKSFKPQEREIAERVLIETPEVAQIWIREGYEVAMNRYNGFCGAEM